MALDSHWKPMYAKAVKVLAGTQKKSMLKEFVSHETDAGEAVFFDTIGDADEANEVLLSADDRQVIRLRPRSGHE